MSGEYMQHPDIDSLINWNDFYRQHITSSITSAGQNKMRACCPFHEDSDPSFWFNTINGLWKCEAGCGTGNATSFLAKVKGIDNSEAWKELCALAGVDAAPQTAKKNKKSGVVVDKYTVREYAMEKRLPEEWLQSVGVLDGGKDGWGGFIRIIYRDENGEVTGTRKRYSPAGAQRFAWGRGGKATLYGLWQMGQVRATRGVVLVEGESDAQTLWHLGISALGVPGATTFQTAWAALLQGIDTVYVHVEPDRGGQEFLRKTARGLLTGGYTGEVKTFSSAAVQGCKDPSDLFIKEGDAAGSVIHGLMRDAAPLALDNAATPALTGLTDPPVALRMPQDWRVTDSGIEQYNARGGQWDRVSWTPILITKMLPGVGGEGVKVELAFRRNGHWHTVRCERGDLASSRRIVDCLSEYGVHVTSENAKFVVQYISELEFENMAGIPEVPRITHFGWIGDKQFAPGLCDGYCLDTDAIQGKWSSIGKAQGDYEKWKEIMAPHRQRALFRFILASAFAAPLLKPLGQRIFMIYNWGDSMGGKSAALFCALSVWGEPDAMKATFNATFAGIERMASFFSDLVLGINERQAAGDKKDFIDKLVYMLSEGSGKLRSNKAGGLQSQSIWRCVILANGEESLSASNTMTGVSTRALELYGGPFPDRETASEMYTHTNRHHGYAGVDFVRRLAEMDRAQLTARYERMRQEIQSTASGQSLSYVMSVSVVALADYLASVWVWGMADREAWDAAASMGMEILGMLQVEQDADVNESAYQHILDWIFANKRQFTRNYTTQRYGALECAPTIGGVEGKAHHVLIVPSILEDALVRAGYSAKKTLRWLAERGHIDTEMEGARERYVVRRQVDGARARFVRLAFPTELDLAGFTEVSDDELPF